MPVYCQQLNRASWLLFIEAVKAEQRAKRAADRASFWDRSARINDAQWDGNVAREENGERCL